jgi:hypothetical protein
MPPADSTPNTDQQTTPAPLNPIAVRDRLQHQMSLLGVRTKLTVVPLGPHTAISLTALWDVDANKLSDYLDRLPELRPYVSHAAKATKEE